MKPTTLFIIFFIALLFTGCVGLQQTAPEQPFANIYDTSSDRLFETTLATLRSQGFTIMRADKSRGTIETEAVKIDAQTAVALFDKTYDACRYESFSIRFTVTPISNDHSQLSVTLLSNQKSNGILEQTLLNNVAVKLKGNDVLAPSKLDVSHAPIVSVSMKDKSTVEGYLLDDTQRGYLRLKLKTGGILHIERDDVERYTLTNEPTSNRN